MRKEIAQIWKAALRSGKYKQTTRQLAKKNIFDKGYSYCCLGVLCEIYSLKNPEFRVKETHLQKSYGHFSDSYMLPPDVQSWAGIKTRQGKFFEIENKKSLIKLNDSGYTFHKIADVICKYQEEL